MCSSAEIRSPLSLRNAHGWTTATALSAQKASRAGFFALIDHKDLVAALCQACHGFTTFEHGIPGPSTVRAVDAPTVYIVLRLG